LNKTEALKTGNYKLIRYKLDEMRALVKAVELDFIKNKMEDCVQLIQKHIVDIDESTKTRLNETLKVNSVITASDAEHYRNAISNLENAECLKKYLGKNMIRKSSLETNLTKQMANLLLEMNNYNLDDYRLKSVLDNFLLMSKTFDIVKPYYEKGLNLVENKLQNTMKNGQLALNKYEFNEFANSLTLFLASSEKLKEHFDKEVIIKMYQELKDQFTLTMQRHIILNIKPLTKKLNENIKELQEYDRILYSANESSELQKHINIEHIREIYESYFREIKEVYDALIQGVKQTFDNEDWFTAFSIAEEPMAKVKLLISIKNLSSRLVTDYYEIVDILCGRLQGARIDFEKEIAKMNQIIALFGGTEGDDNSESNIKTVSLDYNRLAQQILVIRNANWLEEHRKGSYSDNFLNIEKILKEQISDIRDIIE
jgi:hypothetical protein